MLGFPGGTALKNPPANAGTWVQSMVCEDFTEQRSPSTATTEAHVPRA